MNRSQLKVGNEVVLVDSPPRKWSGLRDPLRLQETGYWTARVVNPKAEYPYGTMGRKAAMNPGVEVEITGWRAGRWATDTDENGVKPFQPGWVGNKKGGNTVAVETEVQSALSDPRIKPWTAEKVETLPPVSLGGTVTVASRLIISTVEEQERLEKAREESEARAKVENARRKAERADLMERYAALGIETEEVKRHGVTRVRIKPTVAELLTVIEEMAEERDEFRRFYNEELRLRRALADRRG